MNVQVEALNAEILELGQELAELQVKEKAMIEGEQKVESLQRELASIGERLNEKEVRQRMTGTCSVTHPFRVVQKKVSEASVY